MLFRRLLLSAGGALLARPALAQPARTLRFIPEGDVAILDPSFSSGSVTRNHGYLVFDTLFGQDASFAMQPQMLAGHSVEQDGRLWLLTLREGLRFHDGEPVRAQDAVASIRRFAIRDAFGQALMDATEELSAADDRTIRFRLKRPFPMLPAALGKTGPLMPAIMPERLANTPAAQRVTEMIGSGPYRFIDGERVPGSFLAYERFDGYVPRTDGPVTGTAGPKRPWFDRVEWHVIPDPGTAAAALTAGEVDWWQEPTPDLQELLKRNQAIRLEVLDVGGSLGCLRFNQLFPPFDNPAIRRALLGAVDQAEVMTAVAGDDHDLWRDHVGLFSPGTPMASTEGTSALVGPRDDAAVRKALMAAGYKGERVVMLDATDYATIHAMTLVMADAFRRVGMNVDLVSTDWGTVMQRRGSRKLPDAGGWNVFVTFLTGTNNLNPAAQLGLRGNGNDNWFGWALAPRLEDLRKAWFEAPDEAAQKEICVEMQRQFWIDVPYLPLGCYYEATAYRGLEGIRTGFPQFYNVRRVG